MNSPNFIPQTRAELLTPLIIEAAGIARENAKRDRTGEPLLAVKPKCPPKNCLRHSFVTY